MRYILLISFCVLISFCASAQRTLEAEKAKIFAPAYQARKLLTDKPLISASRIIDSLCYTHAANQELVGVIRVEFVDWLRFDSEARGTHHPLISKNYLIALRKVSEPFYQGYLLENHSTAKPFYGNKEIPLYEVVADSVATSLIAKEETSQNYQLRGRLRFGNEKFKGAAEDFESAIRLSFGKPNLELLDYAAESFSKLENYPLAIKYCTMQVDSSKNKKTLLWHRGLYKRELEDYRGALADFSKSLQSNDSRIAPLSDYFILSVMASCKLSLGEYLDAKVILNKITPKLITVGDAGYIYYMKGFADYHLHYKESACANWSKAGENGYTEAYEAIKAYCNKR